jgi:electron transfer flavoprotein alpha subunit
MAEVWVLAEARDGAPRKASLELLTAARELGLDGPVTAVLAGHGLAPLAAALGEAGADQVLLLDDPRLEAYSPDGLAAALAALASERQPAVILGSSTARGRDLVPRLAAALGVGLASDAVGLSVQDGRLVAERPIYAGKATARVRVTSTPMVATVRPNSYPVGRAGGAGTVVQVPLGDYAPGAVVTGTEVSASTRPDVAEAEIIVSGGRGLGGPEHFGLLEDLADALGAAVGASRAVVDAGWRPHGDQVGQTGKTVSPTLYIACGISGAVQHMAGMKTSKVIVAINRDAEAPIFSIADYGVVGDIFEVVPAVTAAVKALKGGG